MGANYDCGGTRKKIRGGFSASTFKPQESHASTAQDQIFQTIKYVGRLVPDVCKTQSWEFQVVI